MLQLDNKGTKRTILKLAYVVKPQAKFSHLKLSEVIDFIGQPAARVFEPSLGEFELVRKVNESIHDIKFSNPKKVRKVPPPLVDKISTLSRKITPSSLEWT